MAYGNGGYEGGQSAKVLGATLPGTYQPMSTDSTVRMPMVAIELDRQQQALGRLHEVISNLEMRLSQVVRSEPPSPASANVNKAPIELVPLAHGLSEQNNMLQGACLRLQSLLERIEL